MQQQTPSDERPTSPTANAGEPVTFLTVSVGFLDARPNPVLLQSIMALGLSVRAENCLAKKQINTLLDLVQRSEMSIAALPNLGRVCLNEIKTKLREMGFRLGTPIPETNIETHSKVLTVGIENDCLRIETLAGAHFIPMRRVAWYATKATNA